MSIGVLLIILVVCVVVVLYLHPYVEKESPASKELTAREILMVGIYLAVGLVGALAYFWIWVLVGEQYHIKNAVILGLLLIVVITGLMVMVSNKKTDNYLNQYARESGYASWEEKQQGDKRKRIEQFWKPASRIERGLQDLADSLLPLFDYMPRIKVKVVDEPIQSSEAYCTGSGDQDGAYIGMKEETLRSSSPGHVEHVLKHEMVHAWMFWKGIRESDPHGPMFRAKARQVGSWG